MLFFRNCSKKSTIQRRSIIWRRSLSRRAVPFLKIKKNVCPYQSQGEMVCRVKDLKKCCSFFITVARFNLALKLCLTFLTSESVAVTAINIVPFVSMILKETKRMNTVLIVKVVWLVFRPVMEVIRCSIAPHKFPFSIYIREPQPRMLPAM